MPTVGFYADRLGAQRELQALLMIFLLLLQKLLNIEKIFQKPLDKRGKGWYTTKALEKRGKNTRAFGLFEKNLKKF